jgi:hypothetical protein
MASRSFTDTSGRSWIVWDVYPSSTSSNTSVGVRTDLRHGWLAFESEGLKRRLAPIPEGWSAMAEEALMELCLRAEPAKPPRQAG